MPKQVSNTKLASRIQSKRESIVNQLAKSAKIEPEQAARVLDVLQVNRLMDQMNTVEQLSRDKKTMEALNIHQSDVSKYREAFTIENLSLDTLRLGVLSTKLSGHSIMV